MQFKSELHKSLSHHLLYVPGIVSILGHADKIIRISHKLTNSSDLRLNLFLKPQVQHIVQEYIGNYWAEITALRCPYRFSYLQRFPGPVLLALDKRMWPEPVLQTKRLLLIIRISA